MKLFLSTTQGQCIVSTGVYRISATRALLALASVDSLEAFARPHATPWLPGKIPQSNFATPGV